MMQGLLNQAAARAQQQGAANTKIGIVRSYDPNNYCVQVELQPDGVMTGWMPLKSPFVGNGWGMFCAPSIGDLVDVDFQEGDGGVPSAGLRYFSDERRPLAVPSGEFWLVHASGSSLKFTNDGKVYLHAVGNIESDAPQWNHTGNFKVTGDITATGEVGDQGGAKTMSGMRSTFNSHKNGPYGLSTSAM